MVAYVLIVAVALLNVLSVGLFKSGVLQAGGISISDLIAPMTLFQKFVSTPFLMLGVLTAICTNLFWLMVLTRLEASIAVPLMNGIFYLILLSVSVTFLGEEVSVRKIVAIGFILLGVVLIAR